MKKVPLQIGRIAHIGWDMLGITLLLIISVELFSQAVLHAAGRGDHHHDFRAGADAYHGDAWPDDYYDEYAALRARWRPYTYWQMRPFAGGLITVDGNGLRRTPQPSADGPRVFFFGGSTMWGIGSRDAFTIPSLVATLLEDQGTPANVHNYGEIGYVSTQEVLRLLLELRTGNIPDVVVFYDGINDVTSALHSGVAGIPQNEYRRRAEFNLLSRYRLGDFTRAFIYRWVAQSATVRLARGVLYRLEKRKEALASAAVESDRDALVRDVTRNYRHNVELVRSLAREYGFRALFYWQPVIFRKDTLTPYEEVQLGAAEKYRPFVEACYRSVVVDAAGQPGFRDISCCLRDVEGPCFLDFMHIGEDANAIVAAEIANDLSQVLLR